MEQRNLNIGLLIFRLNLGGFMPFHGIHKFINGVGGIKGCFSMVYIN
jgi:DNA-binding helix-hairpin-helix protein with protein kinase domain